MESSDEVTPLMSRPGATEDERPAPSASRRRPSLAAQVSMMKRQDNVIRAEDDRRGSIAPRERKMSLSSKRTNEHKQAYRKSVVAAAAEPPPAVTVDTGGYMKEVYVGVLKVKLNKSCGMYQKADKRKPLTAALLARVTNTNVGVIKRRKAILDATTSLSTLCFLQGVPAQNHIADSGLFDVWLAIIQNAANAYSHVLGGDPTITPAVEEEEHNGVGNVNEDDDEDASDDSNDASDDDDTVIISIKNVAHREQLMEQLFPIGLVQAILDCISLVCHLNRQNQTTVGAKWIRAMLPFASPDAPMYLRRDVCRCLYKVIFNHTENQNEVLRQTKFCDLLPELSDQDWQQFDERDVNYAERLERILGILPLVDEVVDKKNIQDGRPYSSGDDESRSSISAGNGSVVSGSSDEEFAPPQDMGDF